jgi:hypothetical protein
LTVTLAAGRAARTGGDRLGRLFVRQHRQGVDLADHVIEAQRDAGQVDPGSAFSLSMSRAMARRMVMNCGLSERDSSVGVLQRDQGALHVAGQLQLLAGGRQHLLDFGQRPFVAVLRQVLVQLFERQPAGSATRTGGFPAR